MRLPAADDLFRPTAAPVPHAEPETSGKEPQAERPEDHEQADGEHGRARHGRRPSGRVRHDEKMTVYVTAEELLDLEHARLLLRRDHGVAVDRGRLVRAAVALALADLDLHGEDSEIVQRLKQA